MPCAGAGALKHSTGIGDRALIFRRSECSKAELNFQFFHTLPSSDHPVGGGPFPYVGIHVENGRIFPSFVASALKKAFFSWQPSRTHDCGLFSIFALAKILSITGGGALTVMACLKLREWALKLHFDRQVEPAAMSKTMRFLNFERKKNGQFLEVVCNIVHFVIANVKQNMFCKDV